MISHKTSLSTEETEQTNVLLSSRKTFDSLPSYIELHNSNCGKWTPHATYDFGSRTSYLIKRVQPSGCHALNLPVHSNGALTIT